MATGEESRSWDWSPGRELGGGGRVQIQEPLWFSIKSPLTPDGEGLGSRSHIREGCEEAEVDFICIPGFSPLSSVPLEMRAGWPSL